MHPTTPDGRYFVVKGQLWRCSNPELPEVQRAQWVSELMGARRAVRDAADEVAMREARQRVQMAKVALGERGAVWWDDGAPDYNRRKVTNTPYAAWYASLVKDTE